MDKILKEITKMGYTVSVRLVNNDKTNMIVNPKHNETETTDGTVYIGDQFVWKNIPNDKLAKKIMKFEEDSANKLKEKLEKQKWRPTISTSRYDHYALSWWSLREPEYSTERKEYHRYVRNWVGLSVSEISKVDFEIISQFLKNFKKTEVFSMSFDEESFEEVKMSDFFADKIKPADWFEYGITCMSIWFKDLDTHNKFVSLLDSITERTVVIEIGEMADLKAIKKTLKDDNYMFSDDRGKSYISMIDDGIKPVIVKMFAG